MAKPCQQVSTGFMREALIEFEASKRHLKLIEIFKRKLSLEPT